MERRLLITGLAAVATGAAFEASGAQQSEAAAEPPPSGDAERLYLTRMRAAGALSLALSRLAAKRGDDDDVKEFVQFEIAEQETFADVMRTIERPGPVSGRIKVPSDVEFAALLDDTSKDTLKGLDGKQNGSPFDLEYIRLQIEGHKLALEIQLEYLAAGRNVLSVTLAKLARVAIKEHLTLLSDINAALGRG